MSAELLGARKKRSGVGVGESSLVEQSSGDCHMIHSSKLRLAAEDGTLIDLCADGATSTTSSCAASPVILLQGPVGGFFGGFANFIRATYGIPVLKVQYNLGDVVCDRADWSIRYRGTMAELQIWYEQLFRLHRPRAVVAFGDERPVHRVARKACQALGIPFYTFEEGYFRPHYVTFERHGNNANSLMAESVVPAVIPFKTALKPKVFGSNIPAAAWRSSVYFAAMWCGRAMFRGYEHHRDRKLGSEIAQWVWCYGQNLTYRKREIRQSVEFAEVNKGNYFVLALQVFDDLQLLRHGREWRVKKLICRAMASFARSAPEGTKLLVKQHPLDTGHRNYAKLIARMAEKLGITDRVLYLRYAQLQHLLEESRGLVTVNSTVGISALDLGCPVITMGSSLYTRDGLAVDGSSIDVLDGFWNEPSPVDKALFTRFKAGLLAWTQINGDFYIAKARQGVFQSALARILHDTEAMVERRRAI